MLLTGDSIADDAEAEEVGKLGTNLFKPSCWHSEKNFWYCKNTFCTHNEGRREDP